MAVPVILQDALFVTTSILSIVGIGGLFGAYRVIKNSGVVEANRKRDIEAINKSIGAIEHTLNNGGLVRELKSLQMNCAGQIMSVIKDVEAHKSLPGHGELPQVVAALEARVESLEESRINHHG